MPCDAVTFRNLFSRIDIALDVVTYNGDTTTCDALWMGVPVVTLAGDAMAGRRGATILNNTGMRHWIAKAPEQYLAIAEACASDIHAMEELRARLRQHKKQSPITDGKRYTRALESACRDIWRQWCNRK